MGNVTKHFQWIILGGSEAFDLIKILYKNYKEEINGRYFLETDVKYFEKLDEPHNDLLFLSERMKIPKSQNL